MVGSPENNNHIVTTQWTPVALLVDLTSGAKAVLHISICQPSLVGGGAVLLRDRNKNPWVVSWRVLDASCYFLLHYSAFQLTGL